MFLDSLNFLHVMPRRKQRSSLIICLLISLHLGCNSTEPPANRPVDHTRGVVPHTHQIPPFFADDRDSLEYDMPVKNETGRPLRFTHVRPSCACAGATRVDSKELAPGQETMLHFDINLRHRTGAQRFVCHLVEENGTEWTYALETTIYERARFAEVGSIHFGMVNPGVEEVRETDFYLYAENSQKLPQEVIFRTGSHYLRVETGPSSVEQKPDGMVFRKIPLKLHLHAPKTPGLQNTSVYARIFREKEKQDVQTGVDWNVRTLLTVSPAQVYFGIVDPSSSKTIERRITLQSPDGRSLAVKSVTASCPQVHCSIEGPREGSMVRLLLVLNPRAVGKPFWGEVAIETNNPLQPSIKVPIAALSKSAK
jgi:hypothetical protein